MKLELGAGATAHDGYVAFDLNPKHADIVGDASGPLPFDNGTVTHLRAVDILEHISWRDTDRVLAEWARVCAPGAELYVQVPDAALVMRWYDYDDPRLRRIDTGPASPIVGANWRLMGGHADGRYVDDGDDWRFNAHYSLWDQQHLVESLDRAGFDALTCVTNAHPNLCVTAKRR